jgi:hypothetical protein
LLHSEFYKLVFGSWKKFEDVVLPEIESSSLLASTATPERLYGAEQRHALDARKEARK